ncbi:MAG: cobyric acid synthase CobQ, partial [Firmicutes bacterium]|nr:cobyric acid synthase CobQ [Bacillota bacterium]
DCQATADALVKALAEMKGIDPSRVGKATGKEYKEQQYDLLADTVRAHMDMKKIYEMLEAGL